MAFVAASRFRALSFLGAWADRLKQVGQRFSSALTARRIASTFCLALTYAVLATMVFTTVAREFEMLGASTVGAPYPMPFYEVLPVPGTAPTGGGRLAAGADFAQVYTSALALRHDQSAYNPESTQFRDRFGRPSNYPPLTNWMYAPLSRLDYGPALLVHTVVAIALLFVSTALVLGAGGLLHQVPKVLAAQGALYFLTPIGLSHFERGQFDLFVATASVLCVGCVFWGRKYPPIVLCALAGLLGAMKWTSLPFIACFSALGFLLSSGSRRWAFFLAPAVLLLATVGFWGELQEYWSSIRVYELDAPRHGLTLQHFLSRPVARAVPLVVTFVLAGIVLIRARSAFDRSRMFVAISVPAALALTNLALCFGTLSYEYRTTTTLGMLPGLVLWIEKELLVPNWLKATTATAYGIFLYLAFRSILPRATVSDVAMSSLYALFTLFFVGVCVYVLLVTTRTPLAQPAVVQTLEPGAPSAV